jgi:hypothetical protein
MTKNLVHLDNSTPCTATNREYYVRNLTPLRNEDFFTENLIQVRKLTKSAKSSKSPSPLNNSPNKPIHLPLSPTSKDESPLIKIKEPKIQTTKKRSETPKPYKFHRIKKINWVFKPNEQESQKSIQDPVPSRLQKNIRTRGKVFKGKCFYPQHNLSPIRIFNIKLSCLNN